MRRKLFILMGIFLFILLLGFSPPFFNYLVKRQLRRIFTGSEIALKRCILKPKEFRLVNLEIEQREILSFRTKELNIKFTPLSLLQGMITKCVLKEGLISVNMDKFKRNSTFQPGFFKIKAIELNDMDFTLEAKDFDLKAYLFFVEVNLEEKLINFLNLRVSSFSLQGIELKEALLEIRSEEQGSLEIKNISYGKLKVEDIEGIIQYQKEKLSVSPLSAKCLKGNIEGELNLEMGRGLKYQGSLRFSQLNIRGFEEEFKLKDKFQLSGLLEGSLVIEGRNFDFRVLKGDFIFPPPGGILIIKDENLLKNLSEKSGQSFDIIVESFKDFHYNSGIMNLYLEKGDLVLKVSLEGDEGKRNLEMRIHDFKWGR